jgi:hypothetical protein
MKILHHLPVLWYGEFVSKIRCLCGTIHFLDFQSYRKLAFLSLTDTFPICQCGEHLFTLQQ